MKFRSTLAAAAFAVAAMAGGAPAAGAVITQLPGGVAHAVPAAGTWVYNSQPVQFGQGGAVSFHATDLSGGPMNAMFGFTGAYNFGSQPWGLDGVPYIAVGLTHAVLNFTFDTPVSAAGAEFNWWDAIANDVVLSAYGADGALLEQTQLAFTDSSRTDQAVGFYGFQRSRADISRISISGFHIGARNISTLVEVSAVPEPATWAMMIFGFFSIGAVLRRRPLTAAA